MDSDVHSRAGIVTYEPSTWVKVYAWSIPPLCIAGAITYWVRHPSDSTMPFILPIPSLIVAWFAYMVYWRLSWRLELDGATLRWRGTLRRGELPLAELERVEAAFVIMSNWGQRAIRLRIASRQSILVMYGRGFRAFADALMRAVPTLHIERL